MSTGPLQKLSIEYLRGSVQPFTLEFEKGKQLTIVYGENGTGKSTICDAFEFLGKGLVGSLENRGLGKTTRYWHSLGKKASDVAVSLTRTGGPCRATIGKSEVVVAPPGSRPRVEVLRRTQISSLIEAKPADRYAAISRFVDVSGVEQSEDTLRRLIADLESNRGVAIACIQENEKTIQHFWETAGKPGSSAIAWAETEVSRDTTVFEAEAQALHALQIAYHKLADYPPRLDTAHAALVQSQQSLDKAKEAIETCLKAVSHDAAETVEVLRAGSDYLAKHAAPSICPLCESPEKVATLAARVNERLATFSTLQVAQGQLKTVESAVKSAEQNILLLQGGAKQQSAEFEKCRKTHTWPSDVTLPPATAPETISELSSWLKDTAGLPSAWKVAESQRNGKKDFVVALRKALLTWRENIGTQKDLDVLLPRLKTAHKIVQEERQTFTNNKLSQIANEVGRLYELVHPGEGLDKISLELDAAKRASLEIGASFCGQKTPPQAYFSDSHLDTLGLCIFLALAALDQADSTILVLDDVLASVDEPHVDRLIEMLYAETAKFCHCLVTTHYRPWRQKFRWGWLKNNQCQFIELTTWSSSAGLALIRTIPDVERLRSLLAESPPDPQLVCAKAGVILEAALDFLTLHYECRVPRRSTSQYTLGELLPAVDKKLRDALRVEVQTGKQPDGTPLFNTVNLATILDELTRIAELRNVMGCHFNKLSFELLDQDASTFGKHVLELMDALTDPDAGWPRNGRSGQFWATSTESRRLHPYKKPT